MTSIRRKLFIQIGSLVILLIGSLFLVNTLFLEDFYAWGKKRELIETYNIINQLDETEYTYDNITLNKVNQKSRFDVIIGTNEKEMIFTTNTKIDKLVSVFTVKDPRGPKFVVEKVEDLNNQSKIIWARDDNNGMKLMLLEGYLDNGHFVALHFPLASIQPNILIVNQFLLIIGSIIFILSLGLAYLISKSFTQPILNMNKVTKDMIQLNFDQKCQVNSNDEIGQLSESINELSGELSAAMDELKVKNKALEVKVDEKKLLAQKRKELLSNVSHELKTPLALITGYAEGLPIMAQENPSNMLTYGEIILDEARKMNTLIERILDVDQIESGHLLVNQINFDLNDTINQHIKGLEALANERGLLINYTSQPCMVHADKLLMDRVISNLLTNALYHSKSHEIQVFLTQEKDHVILNVSNVSDFENPSQLDNLFDSFYKHDQARTRHKGGHGLGLSIVKAIMQAHDLPYGVKLEEQTISFWIQIPNGG